MPSDRPPTIDPVAARRWAALPHPDSPWLHQEVARRMAERLPWIRLPVTQWVHWEPVGGGQQARALVMAHYPDSACFEVAAQVQQAPSASESIAKHWWQRLLPGRRGAPDVQVVSTPPEGAAQLLWANMLAHHHADPQALMADWRRALAPDGFLMFSCFGPDTLRELRALYAALGWPVPSHTFTDMHDWGDMLVHAGFAEPVMDMEHITLTFATPERLLQELRELGANLHPQRFVGLRGRRWHGQLCDALTQHLASAAHGGQLALTFEIIYGHAFKPTPRVAVSGHSAVSLQDMRAMLRSARPPQEPV